MSTQLATPVQTISLSQTDLSATLREDDTLQHIEDTALLYWVTRRNRPVKLAWNEMTAQERIQQIEAQERAYFVEMFDPNYTYAY